MQSQRLPVPLVQDRPSKVLNILSFFCPPVGLVVYLSLVGKLPSQALSAGMSAARGLGALLVVLLLYVLLLFGIWLADDVLNLLSTPEPAETTASTKPPMPPR